MDVFGTVYVDASWSTKWRTYGRVIFKLPRKPHYVSAVVYGLITR